MFQELTLYPFARPLTCIYLFIHAVLLSHPFHAIDQMVVKQETQITFVVAYANCTIKHISLMI